MPKERRVSRKSIGWRFRGWERRRLRTPLKQIAACEGEFEGEVGLEVELEGARRGMEDGGWMSRARYDANGSR